MRAAALIAVCAAVTILLRFLPFLIFGGKKEIPGYITYLSGVLPYAIMGMLVMYCLRKLTEFRRYWLPRRSWDYMCGRGIRCSVLQWEPCFICFLYRLRFSSLN